MKNEQKVQGPQKWVGGSQFEHVWYKGSSNNDVTVIGGEGIKDFVTMVQKP